MRAYELMVIIDAELDDEVIDATVKRIAGLLDQRGATVKSEDRWGRRRFAYEINHKHEGYYVVWELWEAATSTSSSGRCDSRTRPSATRSCACPTARPPVRGLVEQAAK